MIEIFADPITVNCKKVLSGLKLLEVNYTLNKVDFFKEEFKSEAYLAINPNASLPALRDGDFILWESNAILQYVADKYGKYDFYPADLEKRADVNRWLLWEAAQWFPSCYTYLVEYCVKPLLDAEPDQDVINAETPNFHKLASILDNRLSQSDWLCGRKPTIADIAVAAPMHMHKEQKLPLDPHPNLSKWMTERVEALPSWQETRVLPGFVLPS